MTNIEFARWLAKAQLRQVERMPWYYQTPARITRTIIAAWTMAIATAVTAIIFLALVISYGVP